VFLRLEYLSENNNFGSVNENSEPGGLLFTVKKRDPIPSSFKSESKISHAIACNPKSLFAIDGFSLKLDVESLTLTSSPTPPKSAKICLKNIFDSSFSNLE